MMTVVQQALNSAKVVEIRYKDGRRLEDSGIPIYEVFEGPYATWRGTAEQLSSYVHVQVDLVNFLAMDAENAGLLVRNQVHDTWHALNALEFPTKPRSLAGDIEMMKNSLNAAIYRCQREDENYAVIGALGQAYGWLEQALDDLLGSEEDDGS